MISAPVLTTQTWTQTTPMAVGAVHHLVRRKLTHATIKTPWIITAGVLTRANTSLRNASTAKAKPAAISMAMGQKPARLGQ